jgi:MFS family permease
MSVTQGNAGETEVHRRRRKVWGNRDFLKLWAGETVSLFGSEVTLLALPLAAVLTLRATPGQLGILNAAKYAPFLLLSLPVGVWVDRFRRRPILLAANVGSALALGSVPLLSVTGVLNIGFLVAIAFVAGVFAVFLHVGFWSYVPSLVEADDLTEANSKLFASSSAAAVGGPGLGGILVQLLTAPGALLFDASSFLAAAGSLVSIKRREPAVDEPPSRRLRTEIREGLRFVFGNRYLRSFAGEAATYNFFDQAMLTAFFVYAVRVLDMGPGILGAVIASSAVGTFFGSLIAERAQQRLALGRAIVWAMVLGTWPYLLVPVASGPGALSLLVLTVAFFSSGFGIGVSSVLVVTLRQTITPDRLMGRMNASYRFVVWGTIAAGALVGGVLGGTLGLRPTLVIGVLGIAAAPAWIILSPIGRLRTAQEVSVQSRE